MSSVQLNDFATQILEKVTIAMSMTENEKSKVCRCISGYTKREGVTNTIIWLAYRVWNAVKSLFGRSDWQVAKKDLLEIHARALQTEIDEEVNPWIDNLPTDLIKTRVCIQRLPRELHALRSNYWEFHLASLVELNSELSQEKFDQYLQDAENLTRELLEKYDEAIIEDSQISINALNRIGKDVHIPDPPAPFDGAIEAERNKWVS